MRTQIRRPPSAAGAEARCRAVLARVAGAIAAALLLSALPAAAQPSRDLSSYVLFAQDAVRLRATTVVQGDVGVNDGIMSLRGTIGARQSRVVANRLTTQSRTTCLEMFTNGLSGSAPACPLRGGVAPQPLIPGLAAACGYPAPFPRCAGGADVVVAPGAQATLPAGTYGTLTLLGGGSGPAAIVVLDGGTYVFCTVQLARGAKVLFRAPSVVYVGGSMRSGNEVVIGADPAAAVMPEASQLVWYVAGNDVSLARNNRVTATLCAPGGRVTAQSRTQLLGQVVAKSIKLRRVTVGPYSLPGVCGDGVISPDEDCEVDEDCDESEDDLRRRGVPEDLVCSACACVPVGATTTTSLPATTSTTAPPPTTSTTLTPPTTTSTTLPPPCTTDEDCNGGSAGGAFVCEDGRCVPVSTTTTSIVTTTTTLATTSTTLVVPTTTSTTLVVPTTSTTITPATSTTVVTVTTTSTTVAGGCTTDADCNGGSSSGAFVCEDGRCVVRPTTSTSVPATTSTTTAATSTTSVAPTTTTTPPPRCVADSDCPAGQRCLGNVCRPGCTGDADCTAPEICVEGACGGPCGLDADCPAGEVCAAGVCTPGCTSDADCRAPGMLACTGGRCVSVEVCGDCTDNDGNGLTDFEDPACCAGGSFTSTLRRGRLRARGATSSYLRLKSTLADPGAGMRIDPPRQNVFLQIRDLERGQVLCARVPRGKFLKEGRYLKYRAKLESAKSAQGLKAMTIVVTRKGKVKFRTVGPKARFAAPEGGTLQITVGFQSPDGDAGNSCSAAARAFRPVARGLRFP